MSSIYSKYLMEIKNKKMQSFFIVQYFDDISEVIYKTWHGLAQSQSNKCPEFSI